MNVFLLVPEHLAQPHEFIGQQYYFVFVIVDDVFVVAGFHNRDFVLLALLLKRFYLSVAVVQHLPAFADLAFEAAPLVLESDGHLPYFSIDHGLPLALHQVSEFFQLLGLALL